MFGPLESVPGVRGQAVKLDGFRSYIRRDRFSADQLTDGFTLEGWIALASYPWSWAPVIDCSAPPRGFFFGVGPEGRLGMKLAVGAIWREVITEASIPLREWTHIAAVFQPGDAVTLFLNGQQAARLPVAGKLVPSLPGQPLTLGRTNRPTTWREHQLTSEDVYFFLDGILDEVRVTREPKSAATLLEQVQSVDATPEPALSKRDRLPTGPTGDGSFGAFYTRLDYYKEWDALWRVGDTPDIFVRFDQSPVQLVFWRGTSFVPCWVTENDVWYTNEWMETWGRDVVSCAEPIMDRHCRFSHVRLLEQTPARVVVHWRYALNDAFYEIAAISDDGRGEWADEYHIIYPDQIGVRKIDLHYSQPQRKHDWVEQIVVLPPGKHPDDVIHRDAVSLLNMAGEAKTYTWHDQMRMEMSEPKAANISHVHLKSKHRPFIIIPPDPVDTVEGTWDSPYFRSYAANMASHGYRPDPVPSVFGWWDHWPVAQVPGDGRWVTTSDRPSHFNLTTFVQWKDHQVTPKTRTRIMLQGMTAQGSDELVSLGKSWLRPAELSTTGRALISRGYDPAERAYVLDKVARHDEPMVLELAASAASPLQNPAFIIRNWGPETTTLEIDGASIPAGPRFRQGHRSTVNGYDLIVWLEFAAKKPVRMQFDNR
jgi:hypothetical protein